MLKKKKKEKSNNVTKLDLMKLRLLFNCLDLETITKVKEIVDQIYDRKFNRYSIEEDIPNE